MVDTRGKRILISVSSSSSEEEEEEPENEDEDEDEDENIDNDDDDDDDDEEEEEEEEETSILSTSDDESESSFEEEEADRESIEDDDSDVLTLAANDDEAYCNRVIHFLKGGKDLQALKLEECKSYLRKHGLRLTGTKTICIQRIQEHWRVKDGNGENLYPRSSFVINCTGDVCKGDVVLFTQRVYEKFDKVTRSGNILGKRTIAGRVVKESYGAAKQQHTFTVEIVWSKGVRKLPPLFPLLVKGRNLYRLKTFRQRWNNEAERSKVLVEKHKRGAAARHIRETKKNYKNFTAKHKRGAPPRHIKETKKKNSANRGAKRQRDSNHTKRPPKRTRNGESRPIIEAQNHRDKHRKNGVLEKKAKRVADSKTCESSPKHLKQAYPIRNDLSKHRLYTRNSPAQNPYQTRMGFHPMNSSSSTNGDNRAYHFSNHEMGPSSTSREMPPFMHYRDTLQNGFNQNPYSDPRYQLDPMNHHYAPSQFSFERQRNAVPLGADIYRGRNSESLSCSTPGCREVGGRHCIVSSCWRCCRRVGRRCAEHQLHSPF